MVAIVLSVSPKADESACNMLRRKRYLVFGALPKDNCVQLSMFETALGNPVIGSILETRRACSEAFQSHAKSLTEVIRRPRKLAESIDLLGRAEAKRIDARLGQHERDYFPWGPSTNRVPREDKF